MTDPVHPPNKRFLSGRVLINGRWYEKDAAFDSFNPATGASIGSVPLCGENDVAMAVKAAREAGPGWASLSLRRRSEYLERLANLIREEGDKLAALITRENGKPLVEAHFIDVLGTLDFLAGLLKKGPSLLVERRARVNNPLLLKKKHRIRRLPIGVVGVISPWNLPLAIPMGQILPALLAGNTVVFKPSELTPFVGLEIAGLVQRAGFPPGVFNCLTGKGETGKALVGADIDAILFTGSVATGRAIREATASRPLRLQMELGGKDAFIVIEDANLDRCVNGALWAACFGSGQACSSAERFYVQSAVVEEFARRAVRGAKAIRVGNGMEEGVDLGPMVSEEQLLRVDSQVKEAVAGGAKLLTGGEPVKGSGWFYPPTVITEAPPACSLMREETFGPVISIAAYDDLEDAIKVTESTGFGLSASIWTSDLEKGRAVAERLNVGSVWINDASYTHGQPYLPWGGQRESGMGRTHWVGVLHEMTTPQVVGIDSGRCRREPWWFPYDRNGLDLARYYRIFGEEGILKKLMVSLPLVRALFKVRGRE